MAPEEDGSQPQVISCQHCIERMKSELLVNISHEFRTPLTLVLGPLQDLEEGVHGRLGRQAARQVALARRNAGRVLELVDQLLDAARVDAGAMQLHVRRGELGSFLRRLAEGFEPDAERRGIELDVSGPGAAVELWFDPDQLEKVFTNLIANAFKFTHRGGTVKVSVDPPAKGSVTVRVDDDGPGIAAVQLPHVFRRFYRGGTPGTGGAPGTGLGLALARDLAELHGGSLTARSIPGEGSTFSLRLRLGREHFAAEQVVEEAQARLLEWPLPAAGSRLPAVVEEPADDPEEPATADDHRPLVLVVDDHCGMRAYLRQQLAGSYRVVAAADGAAALALARARLPDLVVSDVRMPGMSGYQLCQEIKGDPELDFVPVILLTAHDSSSGRVRGLEDGADDYLNKPFQATELRARIGNLIASRRRLLERFEDATGSQTAPSPAGSSSLPLASDVIPGLDDLTFLDDVRRAAEELMGDESLTVERLASRLAIDRSHLFRRLRELTGLTPSAMIRELRLQQAAKLIAAGGVTVSEVAWQVGFKDVSHFSKRFRARYRVTPSQYREGGFAASP